MKRAELQRQAEKFKREADECKSRGDNAGAEKWIEAIEGIEHIIQRQSKSPEHMRKMRETLKRKRLGV